MGVAPPALQVERLAPYADSRRSVRTRILVPVSSSFSSILMLRTNKLIRFVLGKNSGAIFKTLHFLCKLRTCSIG
jgi:hypothetical protein